MTAENLDKLLQDAGISLPEEELRATLPGADWLLTLASHLPEAAHD
ncbi:hypothetical protein [Sagittula sp. S175]